MAQNKKLQKLSRAELLELLLAQSREAERLREQLEKANEKLADRHIRISNAGDLAHAVVEVNGVMDATRAAAQQYLDNIAIMYQEAEKACAQMIEQARCDAARIRRRACLEEADTEALLEEVQALLDEYND